MRRKTVLVGAFLLIAILWAAVPATAQMGKIVPVPANSDADHALTEINAATDPAQKLALIDKFAAGPGGQGDMAIVADDTYVNYYIGVKDYDKAFEYGDKLFGLDPDNFANAVNMVRASAEKGDATKLFSYGEKASAILQRYQALPPPEGTSEESWKNQKKMTLENAADNIKYVEQLLYDGAYRTPEASKRAALLVHFAQLFPDSVYANQALGVAAASYQQAQNAPKMLETANGLLAKDPDNVGMLLLIADYYS